MQSCLALDAAGPAACQSPPPIHGPMANVRLGPTLAPSRCIFVRTDLLSCIAENEKFFMSCGRVVLIGETSSASLAEKGDQYALLT